ncbi:ATP-binding protein [Oricola thermophila]|uniref:histidine kinase n=1 Tax=Oricola thermophila TaxID=2742145 RepID=A0A6N1VEU9_9HYPH|nr:ATP-binding protein [Oricola thermophila]QKV19374.1 two-component sensor histidine kinase [Oricola thermophila]
MPERREDSGADAEKPDAGRESILRGVRRRLFSNRFPLTAATVLFAALAAAGAIGFSAMLGCIAVMLAVCAFAPVRSARERRAEQQGRTAETRDQARSAAVMNSLPDPLVSFDAQGTVHAVNTACRRFFNDTVGPGSSVLLRFRTPELLAVVNEALSGGEPGPVEVVERYPIERWYEAVVVRLPEEAAGDAPFLLHFRDLSEARRIDRMRTDFIANASHELRTPLASLSGFIETLAGPARDDPAARDRFLAIMQEQTDRMSRLIDDLLSLSRLETAFGRTDFGPVDVAEVLHHVCGALGPAAADAEVSISQDFAAIDKPGCRVWGSRDELIQVFTNLMENAIRYGAVGGRIDVVGECAPVSGVDSVCVAVRDYGPGIPEEHIPRLTERFYRVDVESSRAKKGTGLGLAIVKHIVTRHSGRLSVTSRIGEGASFTVTIPVWDGKSGGLVSEISE